MPPSLKSSIVRILKEYRSLNTLVDSEVQIEESNADDRKIVVKGEYVYRTLLGAIGERGSYEITLDRTSLNPIRVRISPAGRPSISA